MNKLTETPFGFQWGAAKVLRVFYDEEKDWVTLRLETKKYPQGIQIYVTKTGKVRVYCDKGEWLPKDKR